MTVFHVINNVVKQYAHCYGENLELQMRNGQSEKNYVYFVCDGEYVKIGIANDVKKRIGALQTSNARKLFLIDCIECNTRARAKAFETCLHEKFSTKRKCGEWFDVLDDVYFYDFISTIPEQLKGYSYLVKERNNPNYRRHVRDWYAV